MFIDINQSTGVCAMEKHNDSTQTIQDLKLFVAKLVKDREWEKFSTPHNLLMNLTTEVSELMKLFLWRTTEESFEELSKNRKEIEDETGDVMLSLLQFCIAAKIDLSAVTAKKLAKIEARYPATLYKGKHTQEIPKKS